MKDLKYYENIIKDKRKKTLFKDFLIEILSWSPVNLQKIDGFVSRFPKTQRIKGIVDIKEFENNRDDLLKKSIGYDSDINFFENFKNLFLNIRMCNTLSFGYNENTEFADTIFMSKKVYLGFIIINNCENIMYSISVKDNCNDVINGLSVWNGSSIVYQSAGILKGFKIFYSRYIINSNNIWFSSNLIGCEECIFCSNLENKKYYINNKEFEKTQYFIQKEIILKDKYNFIDFFNNVDKKGENLLSDNVIGNYIINSSNVNNGYFCSNVRNGKNIFLVGGMDNNTNIYDAFTAGSPYGDDLYGVMGVSGNNIYNSAHIIESSNIFYSYFLNSCSYCLGCIGLKNKQYCILNQQYTKEDWEIEVLKIFKKMEEEGILGNFFPGTINPFYFNDTISGLIGGFKKEEVKDKGYMWRDKMIKVDVPKGTEIIKVDDLINYEGYDENENWFINPKILKFIIQDKKGNYYKVIKEEYDFLVKNSLPLPRLHRFDRMKLCFGI
ncbi:MAG: hypothetical protein PHN31_02310 [Candidatus Gracilibacteria bacterium]|nr:hypothetical protein [Candidatus Gracilibacteria bacterium]